MTECMLWAKAKDKKGYGSWLSRPAHRVMYEAAVGEIPQGLHVLHKCDTPLCINPEHLFLGTNADNVADMVAKGRQHYAGRGDRWAAKTHCPRGHEYTPTNTRVDILGSRHCRACDKQRSHHKRSDAPSKPHHHKEG